LITRRSFEYETIVGKEECSFSWKWRLVVIRDPILSHSTNSLPNLSTVSQKIDP
jgi:hypothetical protein